MQKPLGWVIASAFLVLVICSGVIIPAFFMPFYAWQFERPRAYSPFNGATAVQTIEATPQDLMYVMGELLDYMRGRRDTLDGIRIVVAGSEREFYSDLEKRHMVDVRRLFLRVIALRNISLFFIIVALGMHFYFKIPLECAARYTRRVIVVFLALSVSLAGVIAANFERAWDIFHHIFFDNDYWILTHRQDLLLDMVSLSFFAAMSAFVGGLLLLKCTLGIAASTAYLLHKKPKDAGDPT